MSGGTNTSVTGGTRWRPWHLDGRQHRRGLNFSGVASPNITINSDAGTAGKLVLAGDVTSTVTTGFASITSGGVAANPGQLDLGAATRIFSVTTATNLQVSAQVIGSVGLTKAGVGTLTLTGVNTYTGATTICAGIVNANSTAALGDGSATNTLVFTGGTLQAGGTITSPSTRTVTLTSTGLIDTNSNAVSIAGIMSGAVV